MTTVLEVEARVPSRSVTVGLSVAAGETVAVVGPNGAGKSSLLQVVAGTLRPDPGVVRLSGVTLDGPGRHVPPHRRQLAYLQQKSLLFPHLSVVDNVAFGPRSRGTGRGQARDRAMAELEAVGLADLAQRRPRQLSGGQAQRVAIARALAVDPGVLLLDEPFAALDASVTPGLRSLLRDRLSASGVGAVLVTHELLDVVTLARRMVVLEQGEVVADDTVERLCAAPPSDFVADLVGLNLVRGRARSAHALAWDGVEVTGRGEDLSVGAEARATFSPESVGLHREPPGGSPRNVLAATVVAIDPQGPVVEVRLRVGDQSIRARLTPAGVAALDLQAGDRVHAVVKATQVSLFPG